MAATKGIMDHLIMAACEWFLMFWMFVDAALAYSLRRFAKYCRLQIPCLLCSRLDHLFGNEEGGSCSYLFCKKHQVDIAYLMYCNVHDELVDVREMCEDCSNSASLQPRSYYPCSCCKSHWREKSTGQQPIWSNVVGSRGSNATTKPPLPRVARHGRPKRSKNKVKHRHRNELTPVGQYPAVKFTSDSELEFLFSDNDDGGIKVVGISERSLNNDVNGIVNQYKVLGRHAHSTPDLTSAFLLEAHLNECPRSRSRTRSASLTPDCLIRHNLVELKRKSEQFDPLKIGLDKNPSSSMNAKTHGSSHRSLDGSMFLSSNIGSQNRYNIFSRNSFSASDLGSAVRLEMQNNNRLRQRSASLTPNMLSGYGLGEQKCAKNVPAKGKKHKKVSSGNSRGGLSTMYLDKTNGYGYLDDSVVLSNTGNHHNQNRIPRRHSYSVFQLGGEILLNMPTDESQNGSIFYGLEDYKKPKSHSPEKDFINMMQLPRKDDEVYTPLPPISFIRGDLPIAFIDRSKWYGSLDDSAVMRNTRIQYEKSTPRRHSAVNESLTNNSASFAPRGSIGGYGLEQPNNLKFQTRPNNTSADSAQFSRRRNKRASSSSNRNSGYESLDDLVVSFNSGYHDRNKDPRRHSYSAFELGDALLLNAQPIDRSSTNRSASVTRNGAYNHGFREPKQPGFQTVQNLSQPIVFSNKNQGYQSMDDLVVSFNTGFHEKSKDPRRHSYSSFELGNALLLNEQPIDKSSYNFASVTQNGAYNHGFGEPKPSGFQTMNNFSHPLVFLNKNQGYGFMDDSVVAHNTGIDLHNHYHNQKKIPRRHSYSILQLGGDIVLNMPVDESLRSHSVSLAPNESIGQSFGDPQKSTFQKFQKDKNSLPSTGSIKRFNPSYEVRSDFSIDKTKWHGAFDDYLIYRSMGSQSQSNNSRRHSHSAFDLGRALLLEINLDNSLRNFHASLAPHEPTGHGSAGHWSTGHGSTGHGSTGHGSGEHNRSHHHRAKRHNSQLPPPCPMNPLGSSSDIRTDLPTFSFDATHNVRSLDDSFFTHKTGNHNQYSNSNPRRHSYSAFELGCAHLLNMQRDASSTRRFASLTPKIQIVKESQLPNFKKDEQPLPSVNIITDDFSSTSLYKPHGYQSCDESGVSNSRDGRKRSKNLTRNYYSVSDLTSPVILQMNLDQGLTRKSASLTPDCSTGQGFGDLNSLKFQAGSTSSQQKRKKNNRSKAKRNKRSKGKKIKKPLRKVNNVKVTSSSPNAASDASYESFDDSDAYESFDDSETYESNTDSQNRFKIFSRNSQSVSDLGSAVFLEMQPEDRSRNRSKSLTPNCSYFADDSVQFMVKKGQENEPAEVEKDKKQIQLPPTYPAKEMDSSSTTKPDLCPSCSDKIDLRSLDGSVASEIDYDGIEKVKRQAEDDVRCMRLLQSELEAERNAATVAANHAMNMITRLQQEKASLQMEALQYLRMMEEQAEYDMEALQKANELVEEKENEIQDLLNELEQYRNKYGDDPMNMNSIKSFDDEKRYILESLSTLEKKINQLSNGVHDKSPESGNYVDFSKLEHEVLDMKEKMEALKADVDLIKHVFNTLHANEGIEFIQEIAHHLQDLRRIMFDRRLVSSN